MNPKSDTCHAEGVVRYPRSRVLVVDDEERNRSLLKRLLEKRGFSVREAVDGEDALAKVTEEQPDVILLDVMMPRMDGFEVCRRLKAQPHTQAIPILMVTSLEDRDSRLKGIQAGANDFLTKPVDQEEVALRVRNAAYSKQLYDELQEKYRKLREMAELRDSLTRMIMDDTEAVAEMLEHQKRKKDNTEDQGRQSNG